MGILPLCEYRVDGKRNRLIVYTPNSIFCMARAIPIWGAGVAPSWRRCGPFLVQVCFLVGDLRRKSSFCGLQWRMSRPPFHTCAGNARYLRQQCPTPAPAMPHTCAGNVRYVRHAQTNGIPGQPGMREAVKCPRWCRLKHHLERKTG